MTARAARPTPTFAIFSLTSGLVTNPLFLTMEDGLHALEVLRQQSLLLFEAYVIVEVADPRSENFPED
jgi:hypothetical protein